MRTATIEPKRPAPRASVSWRSDEGLRVTVHMPVNNVVVGVMLPNPCSAPLDADERRIVLYAQDAGGWLGIDDSGQELAGEDLPDLVRRAFAALGVAAPADALAFAAEDRYVLGG